jgi:hypothetical protein
MSRLRLINPERTPKQFTAFVGPNQKFGPTGAQLVFRSFTDIVYLHPIYPFFHPLHTLGLVAVVLVLV